jgi:hypothetical protein
MKNWMRALFCVGLVLGLTTPAFATLNDSEQPGSVLVFHKFVRGTNLNPNTGGIEPKTEIEISVTCPKGTMCAAGTTVRLRAHWVCGSSGPICAESDFDLVTTVKGTLYFNPENVFPANAFVAEPPPFCDRGYLIVWVIDAFGRPIKYDGLIGDAIIREADTGQSAGAYNAVPIQAASALATFAPTDVDFDNKLDFNGTEYKAVTGRVFGSVRYESFGAAPFTPAQVETTLTLLTLDIRSNDINNPVVVPFNFYNEFETLRSTSTLFFCWTEVRLADLNNGLTEAFGRKGLVESGQAFKTAYIGSDATGPVTLLGVVETRERDVTQNIYRQYSYSLFHDSKPVSTSFIP